MTGEMRTISVAAPEQEAARQAAQERGDWPALAAWLERKH
jgi:hypothetical protein